LKKIGKKKKNINLKKNYKIKLFISCKLYFVFKFYFFFSSFLGGIGGFLTLPEDKTYDSSAIILQFIFDNIYNIIIMIIMLNIVSGKYNRI
jgi:small-conductance mechanosensitive channel